ncbi:MAG: hypothetical protein C5B55_12075 [Blastocatellia bacterium]|nr:MAG: hypothetical protein C5B55_12075 [Blastocatellia bacterium]
MHLTSLKLRVAQLPAWTREVSIFIAFLFLTALMTWPWVVNLRNAVSDTGDPYMISWTLWWDYHQTFHDPLNLFQANIFYPLRYTLAFSEHDYGIAVLFFPLFAIGLRPLTVHSIATFTGFAFCGYGSFRLTRTLTNSSGAAWIAGVVFAFIPYRFQLLSHLHYLFAGWIPLLVEALAMFIHVRSWKRATWVGVAFLMNGLTCITWLLLTLLPLTLSVLLLVVRHWREANNRQLFRVVPILFVAALLLVPFLWPYYKVTQLYHFSWPVTELARYSAGWSDWFSCYPRTKIWQSFGASLPGTTDRLFPGLLPLLLSLPALLWVNNSIKSTDSSKEEQARGGRLLFVLDALTVLAGVIALLSVGYRSSGIHFLAGPTDDRALVVLLLLIVARWSISYPQIFSRSSNRNLIDSIRSMRRCEGFWIGIIWTFIGFLSSLGISFFGNRVMYELFSPMRSLRIPARSAMVCYVGLAVLAGVGGTHLSHAIHRYQPKVTCWMIYAVIVAGLLFELHASPLALEHGAVDIDGVSQRLKTLNLRGGVVELPGGSFDGFPLHLAMLRAADHEKPLINGASSFYSPISTRIDQLVYEPPVKPELMDLLEEVPTSYVVVRWGFINPERKKDFSDFLSTNAAAGRLRLVGTYDSNVDLYLVTKTEGNQ